MSKLFDGLSNQQFGINDSRIRQRLSASRRPLQTRAAIRTIPLDPDIPSEQSDEEAESFAICPSEDSRLVAITQPDSIGAEKFRALVARLYHIRQEQPLKSVQVTSGVVGEGKTVVASNLAVTFAKHSGAKTLLVEGDLRRPNLSARFGLANLEGLSDWWGSCEKNLAHFAYRFDEMPLWILPAGTACSQASNLLQAKRFADEFTRLAQQFEWVIVDSTPMLPVVDANLWSRVVDGTILVIRENMARVNAIKKGLQALDRPKLVGMVINESLPLDNRNEEQYYSVSTPGSGQGG